MLENRDGQWLSLFCPTYGGICPSLIAPSCKTYMILLQNDKSLTGKPFPRILAFDSKVLISLLTFDGFLVTCISMLLSIFTSLLSNETTISENVPALRSPA